jgi:hypothetical protein
MTHISRSLLFVTAMVMACVPAEARRLHVLSSVPPGETIVDGRNTQYVLQFDGQIDHRTSSMEVVSNGKVVKALISLRGSEPSTLVASAPTLPPGRYQLHELVGDRLGNGAEQKERRLPALWTYGRRALRANGAILPYPKLPREPVGLPKTIIVSLFPHGLKQEVCL